MASTFFGLNIGLTGLYTSKMGLNITGQNIANAATEGYSRQVVNQVATSSLRAYASYGSIGSGVTVKSIEQMRLEYYDVKYRQANARLGQYEQSNQLMDELQQLFNETPEMSAGFTHEMNQLFDAIEGLRGNPSSMPDRAEVVNYFTSLTDYFNTTATRMQSVQEGANEMIKTKAGEINNYVHQLATLNEQINTLEVRGGLANDLRDQRNLVLDKLSAIIPISVAEVERGQGVTELIVSSGGVSIVSGEHYVTMQCTPREERVNQTDVEGLYDLSWSNGAKYDMSVQYSAGELKGIIDVRDGNNADNFQGKVTASEGDTEVTVTDLNIENIHQLNIDSDGYITLGTAKYEYGSYEIALENDGSYSVTFQLADGVELKDDFDDVKAEVGTSVDFKGVPYYMTQLNELLRTMAKSMNDLQKQGVDLENKPGQDLIVGYDLVSGEEYTYTGEDLDSDGQPDDGIDDFARYNNLTVLNVMVASAVSSDYGRLVTASKLEDGVEENDIISAMQRALTDDKIFSNGTVDSFYQGMVIEISVTTDRCQKMEDGQIAIINGIDANRMEVSSVDKDEEAANMSRYQDAFDLAAKIISIFNEIYDVTINGLGV